MAKYNVLYTTTASTYVTVEAESPEDAADKADGVFESPSVCAQCSGWNHGEENSGVELAEWEPVDGADGVWELDS